MPPKDKPHWNAGQLVAACIFISALGLTVVVYLHTGDRAAHDKATSEESGDYSDDVDVRGLLVST